MLICCSCETEISWWNGAAVQCLYAATMQSVWYSYLSERQRPAQSRAFDMLSCTYAFTQSPHLLHFCQALRRAGAYPSTQGLESRGTLPGRAQRH